ncbi:MAG: GDP-mannose 4,6-dehydratase [Nannocystaceae bacterium]
MHPTPARYLVTGGAGFIGSHTVDRLLAAGHEVTVVDNFNDYYDPQLKRTNVAGHLGQPGYRLVEGDIRDAPFVDGLVREGKPEVVIHLAARAGVRPSLTQPHLYRSTNIEGTLNLLEAARHHGVSRFVFGSSSSVYGRNETTPFAEHHRLNNPASPYAATKIAGEALTGAYAHLYGFTAISLRFFTVFGPRQRPDLAIRTFCENIAAGRPITLFGDGSSRRDYTFVQDIVDGILAATTAELSCRHEVCNLGNGSPMTLAQMVATIEDVVGKKAQIERLPDQPGDVPVTFADITYAGKLLGYTPKVEFAEGLAAFMAWAKL